MRKRIPSLTGLRAFEASARLGSHRRAAEELCLDHTVVGKHIRKLESELGVRLLETTPTGTQLTEAGRDYCHEVRQALDVLNAATERLRDANRRPALHITCSPGFGMRWLAPRIDGFLAHHPGLDLSLRPTIRAPNLLAGEADVDIRSTDAAEVPGTVQMILCRPRMYPVASPDFLASHPPVLHLEQLLALPLCHEETHEYWRLWLRAAGLVLTHAPSGPRYWSAALALDAARLGHGVAIANDYIAGDDLAAGRLVEVLPTSVYVYPYVLVARRHRWDEPILARFRAWLMEQIVPHPTR
ncbi:MAG: LysR substrate-binding domain-containing protein [Gammaproteobacteria bacterium]